MNVCWDDNGNCICSDLTRIEAGGLPCRQAKTLSQFVRLRCRLWASINSLLLIWVKQKQLNLEEHVTFVLLLLLVWSPSRFAVEYYQLTKCQLKGDATNCSWLLTSCNLYGWPQRGDGSTSFFPEDVQEKKSSRWREWDWWKSHQEEESHKEKRYDQRVDFVACFISSWNWKREVTLNASSKALQGATVQLIMMVQAYVISCCIKETTV